MCSRERDCKPIKTTRCASNTTTNYSGLCIAERFWKIVDIISSCLHLCNINSLLMFQINSLENNAKRNVIIVNENDFVIAHPDEVWIELVITLCPSFVLCHSSEESLILPCFAQWVLTFHVYSLSSFHKLLFQQFLLKKTQNRDVSLRERFVHFNLLLYNI